MELGEFIETMPLLDHHCHFLIKGDVEKREERLAQVSTEADNSYPLSDTKNRLAWWAFRAEAQYFARDKTNFLQSMDAKEYAAYNQLIFKHYNFKMLLVDTGFVPADAIIDLNEMKKITGLAVKKIYRIETHAQEWMEKEETFTQWWRQLSQQVAHAVEDGFVGFKSIAAYRFGLRLRKVGTAEAKKAFHGWKNSGVKRLSDPALISYIVWNLAPYIIAQNKPLQFHVGYGDADTDLFEGNPLLLRSFLQNWCPKGLKVVLLHCYPYHREAGYLASVFPNLFFDTSLIDPLGPSAVNRVLDEALELAPYSRYLFASDASTYPEMYGVAASRFKAALLHHFAHLSEVPLEQKKVWIRKICYQTAAELYIN
ncbi:amidohydrolase family protein [Liquorilactobacillus oeni]|uniref:Metal-dependent hydrolase of the TIM-barrel fold protein n=1 Tax=Liquorilactobacillus oeni DSM 19972 TaxID=1423777 RepID=A0A0R1MBI5_9LACO|nr:amidohydrolase family protein [Liquorilactobacillus oeni]KRL05249.1 metal-dependent hydrolase of the TIM-barrel fold protein [Liquorilactobacillus oeni DSM 19972]